MEEGAAAPDQDLARAAEDQAEFPAGAERAPVERARAVAGADSAARASAGVCGTPGVPHRDREAVVDLARGVRPAGRVAVLAAQAGLEAEVDLVLEARAVRAAGVDLVQAVWAAVLVQAEAPAQEVLAGRAVVQRVSAEGVEAGLAAARERALVRELAVAREGPEVALQVTKAAQAEAQAKVEQVPVAVRVRAAPAPAEAADLAA